MCYAPKADISRKLDRLERPSNLAGPRDSRRHEFIGGVEDAASGIPLIQEFIRSVLKIEADDQERSP